MVDRVRKGEGWKVRFIVLALVLAACGGAGTSGSTTIDPSATSQPGSATTLSVDTTVASNGTPTTTSQVSPTTTSQVSPTTVSSTTTTTTAGPRAGVIPPPDPNDPLAVVSYVFDSMTTYEEKLPFTQGFEGMEQAVYDWWALGQQYGSEGTRFLVDLWPDTSSMQTEVRVRLQYAGHPPSTPFTVAYYRVGGQAKILKDTFCFVVTSQGVSCPG